MCVLRVRSMTTFSGNLLHTMPNLRCGCCNVSKWQCVGVVVRGIGGFWGSRCVGFMVFGDHGMLGSQCFGVAVL